MPKPMKQQTGVFLGPCAYLRSEIMMLDDSITYWLLSKPLQSSQCYIRWKRLILSKHKLQFFVVVWNNSWNLFTATRQHQYSSEASQRVDMHHLSTSVPRCLPWSKGYAGHHAKWLPCLSVHEKSPQIDPGSKQLSSDEGKPPRKPSVWNKVCTTTEEKLLFICK